MPRRRRPPRSGAMAELPPMRIAAQIAALQGLYYLGAVVFMLFTSLVAGTHFGMQLVFGWEAVRGDTTQGWLTAFVWLLNGGFCMSIAIILLISRSKLVPDFAITIHGLHFVISSLYTRMIPRNAMWWMTMVASSAMCVGLGVWGSQYRELRPIYFGGSRNNAAAQDGGTGSNQNGEPAEGLGDEEQGFSRGRGRGRGRDGAGEYEMVRMKDEDVNKAA